MKTIRQNGLDINIFEYDSLASVVNTGNKLKKDELNPDLERLIPYFLDHMNNVKLLSEEKTEDKYKFNGNISIIFHDEEKLRKVLANSYTVLALHAGKIVGSGSIVYNGHEYEDEEDDFRVKYLYVSPSYQKNGISKIGRA